MASTSLFRVAMRARSSAIALRPARFVPRAATSRSTGPAVAVNSFSSFARRSAAAAAPDHDPHDPHHEESFEQFSARYENEFNSVQDVFELQRNLNNAFAYDLVPSPSVITAALKAARRVNDYPTAVRIFEGIKAKVENKTQYEEYLKELEAVREELGISLKEVLYPEYS